MVRCKHSWEVLRQVEVVGWSIVYILYCMECRKIKKVRVR